MPTHFCFEPYISSPDTCLVQQTWPLQSKAGDALGWGDPRLTSSAHRAVDCLPWDVAAETDGGIHWKWQLFITLKHYKQIPLIDLISCKNFFLAAIVQILTEISSGDIFC